MAEKDDAPVQGDLLKALDDLTDLIAEQEQRGRVWTEEQEEEEGAFEAFEFDAAEDDALALDELLPARNNALPSPAEIETLVEQLLQRRMADLREQVTRELMVELRKRYPEL